jgi:hypothetical protein
MRITFKVTVELDPSDVVPTVVQQFGAPQSPEVLRAIADAALKGFGRFRSDTGL